MSNIDTLIARNRERWERMTIRPARRHEIEMRAQVLCAPATRPRYEQISRGVAAAHAPSDAHVLIPWPAIGLIHEREAGGPPHWDRSIAQGDPLGVPSIHVPRGRGPFLNHPADLPGEDAFYRGALDALIDCPPHLSAWPHWETPWGLLAALELDNGLGYDARGLPSPYLWSGTDQYEGGKFVSDGRYDPGAVDGQDGCAPLLRLMMEIDASIVFPGMPAVRGTLVLGQDGQAMGGATPPVQSMQPVAAGVGGATPQDRKTTVAVDARALAEALNTLAGALNAHKRD